MPRSLIKKNKRRALTSSGLFFFLLQNVDRENPNPFHVVHVFLLL